MEKIDILNRLKKRTIGVLYGGFSSERKISIESGLAVISVLRKNNISVYGIDVDRNIALTLVKLKIDLVYIALHGTIGEDGAIQGLLEVMGIAYTGCGVFASAASMDKDISKKLFEFLKIDTPRWIIVEKLKPFPNIERYPVVIKPVSQGSAIGVNIAKSPDSAVVAAKNAFEYDDAIIVEDFIEGTEITVGVLQGKALPVVEIIPNGEFYDFNSKYKKGASEHIIPARISRNVYIQAQEAAEKIYKVFRCKSVCRVDMIVDKNDKIWVLENNTIPGMTATSLLPQEASANGIDFESLTLTILGEALQ
ncbi:MAG: D-alanine--D-alanine ligase [Elusimicrobiota bacterium]|nr:D-alanine--D-alanine ligase [Elusimicrobiota bacterium]